MTDPPGEQELRQRFATRTERWEHGTVCLELLLPARVDDLIDRQDFARDERLPYWAELWPSARALARYLVDHPPEERKAIELGAGVALPSLVLHTQGVRVLATDYYADALRFAEVNASRNDLPPLPTRVLDWRHEPPRSTFSLALAADVLYERRNAETLAAVLPRLVAPAGRFILADPGRTYLTAFLEPLEATGWTVRQRGMREEISAPTTGAISRVRILELRPRTV